MPTYTGTADLQTRGGSYSENLFGYWRFESNLFDSSGRNIHGTGSGSPTYSTTLPTLGFPNTQSLNLTAASQFVTLSDTYDPLDYTISMWVRSASTSNRNIWLRTDSTGANNAWSSQLRITGGKFEHYVFTTTSVTYQAFGLTSISINTWYHVTIVFNSTLNKMYLYVNGVEDSGGGVATTGFPWAGGDRWQIGGNANALVASYPGFVGQIDDLRFYNRAFGPREIESLATGNNFPGFLASANATFNKPVYAANATLSKTKSLVASGIYIKPVYSGTARLSKVKQLNATGISIPAYNGTARLSKHPTLVATGYRSLIGRANLNLFIEGSGFTTDGYIPLYVAGSALPDLTPKAQGSLDLFIAALNPLKSSLNLFIDGVSSLKSIQASLNLYIRADYPSAFGTLPLFIKNESEIITKTLRLFIKGKGFTPGYSAADAALNLFIGGTGSGEVWTATPQEGIPLFIKGVINPVYSVSNGLNLFIKGLNDNLVEDNITLFIEGLNPGLVSNTMTLVIPKTKLTEALDLYIHGF